MSFRELSMVDVREVLRRVRAGQSARQLARDGVVDRKTAQRYVEAAKECGFDLREELSETQVSQVVQRVQARAPVERSTSWKSLEQHREQIESWLKASSPLTLVRVQELLARRGIEVKYTTLRRFAHEVLGWRERAPTVRIVDCAPGEEAQTDFGRMGFVTDAEGKQHALWVLIVTLTMSRHMFVWPTFVQTMEAVIEALDAAWRFFGGVPKRLVPDNMKAIVKRADAKQPELQRAFVEYAQSRGFFVDPARVRSPQDKARVENQVPYVRDRWFAGEVRSADLDVLRVDAESWCRDVAGARIHGTTRAVPREVYDREERAHMLPAPTTPFDVPTWTTAKVHPDHHVQVAKALYSVPTRYLGVEVEARADRVTVKLYFRGEMIKMHPRAKEGGRRTDANDYPIEKAGYAMRSVDAVSTQARQKGASIGTFMERLLDGPLPWIKMRHAYALLRLCDRYGVERVEALCARAVAFDVIDVMRVERMLKSAQQAEQDGVDTGKVVQLPAGRFARDASEFTTDRDRNDGSKGGSR